MDLGELAWRRSRCAKARRDRWQAAAGQWEWRFALRGSTSNERPQTLHLRVIFMGLETARSPPKVQEQEDWKKEEDLWMNFWKKTEREEKGISNRQEYTNFVSPLTASAFKAKRQRKRDEIVTQNATSTKKRGFKVREGLSQIVVNKHFTCARKKL